MFIKPLLVPIVPLEVEIIQPSAFFFSIYNFLEHMGEAIFKDGFSFNCSCVCFTLMFNGNSPTVKPLFYVKQSQLLLEHLILIHKELTMVMAIYQFSSALDISSLKSKTALISFILLSLAYKINQSIN